MGVKRVRNEVSVEVERALLGMFSLLTFTASYSSHVLALALIRVKRTEG